MKKFLVRILIFFVAVAIIDYLFGRFCDYLYSNSKGGDTYKINYAISEACPDVLIMGSSRASHHYNPQIIGDSLGMTVYNLGIDGSGIILMDGFYRLITKRHIPKLIIYELTPAFDIYKYAGDANNTRYLSQLKPYFKKECIKDIFANVDSKERIKLLSGLYRYNTQFINLARFYLFPEGERSDGFRPLYGEMKHTPSNASNDETEVVDHIKLMYLQSFIKECREKGVELVFVVSPSYGEISSDNYLPAFKLCRDSGIPILDHFCDSSFVNNRQLFKDSYHLNEKGANMFSIIIAEELMHLYKQE